MASFDSSVEENGSKEKRWPKPSGQTRWRSAANTVPHGTAETSGGERLDENELEKAAGVCLAFDPRARFSIPPAPQPVRLPPRSRMDEILRPVPENARVPFYVAKSLSKVTLGKNTFGVILMGVEDGTDQRHVQSPFIDADWGAQEGGAPVRFEIFDPAGLSARKPYAHLNLILRFEQNL